MAQDTLKPVSKHSRTARRRKHYLDETHDLPAFERLDPELDYPYLPTDWFAAIMGRGKHFTTRMLDYCCAPHYYLGRRDYPFKASVLWRENAGEDLLIRVGKTTRRARRSHNHFGHELGVSLVKASTELGARNVPGYQRFTYRDLILHTNMPVEIRTATDPMRFTLKDGYHYFDGRPEILQTATTSVGIFDEYDRSTEPLTGNGRITIEKKLLNIKEIFDRKLYLRYNFKSAMVRFTCIPDYTRPQNPYHRQRSIMELAHKLFKGECRYILFKTLDDFEQAPFSVKPHTKAFDEPWQRVGAPDFSLVTLTDTKEKSAA
jgi:hypothetical protein